VIFSDETYVDVRGAQAVYVRRSRGESIRMSHTIQHRPFLQRAMFWGAISSKGPLPLIHVDGTMTATRYVSTLKQHLIPFLENQPLALEYMFQHDNAPSHKATVTTQFLRAEAIPVLPSWPPYSPDLNVIENMWAYVKNVIGL
jgi:hypothetical protein